MAQPQKRCKNPSSIFIGQDFGNLRFIGSRGEAKKLTLKLPVVTCSVLSFHSSRLFSFFSYHSCRHFSLLCLADVFSVCRFSPCRFGGFLCFPPSPSGPPRFCRPAGGGVEGGGGGRVVRG